ncbi:MAG: hypothetical protein ACFFBS_07475 [Promethearchaeota archaeon]
MNWEKASENVKSESPRVGRIKQLSGIDPKLTFNICYWAANSIRSKCVELSETENPYSGNATLLRSEEDDKIVASVSVSEESKTVGVNVWCTNPEYLEPTLNDIEDLIEESLDNARNLSDEKQDLVLRLIDIEKELDAGLRSILSGGNMRSVYFSLADSRETLYKLLGPDHFDPILLSMGRLLETLYGYDDKQTLDKEGQGRIALNVLRWKKRIDELIKQNLAS